MTLEKKPDQDENISELPDDLKIKAFLRKLINMCETDSAIRTEDGRNFNDALEPLHDKETLSLSDFYIAIKNYNKMQIQGGYMNAFSRLPNDEINKWSNLIKFLIHDISHIEPGVILDHARQTSYINYKRKKRENPETRIKGFEFDPFISEFQLFYKEVLKILPEIVKNLQYPYVFTKAIAEYELNGTIEDFEKIDLVGLIKNTATGLQLRFVFDDYIITTPESRNPERNEIILDLNPVELAANSGMVWSIVYNLLKNAMKELSCQNRERGPDLNKNFENTDICKRLLDGEMPKSPKKLVIKTEMLEKENYTLIHVMDSGEGLKIDEIMNSLKNIIKENLLNESDIKKPVKKIIEEWERNPFAVRALRMGDIYDLAGIARTSGFITRERTRDSSSGMGLWGVNYMINMLGGEIIYTNTLKEGALFTIIIPNNYFSSQGSSKKITQEIRAQIEKGEIPVKIAA